MKAFEDRIEEIEAAFADQDTELRQELHGTSEALAAAEDRVEALKVRYQSELIKGGQDATRLKVELTVAEDTVRLLAEMAEQLRADLNSGELVEARLRRHEAVVAAVHEQGNAAIAAAIQAAEQARDNYRAALAEMIRVQHAVADTGRKSVFLTSQTGRPCNAPTVARYNASEFAIEEPSQSASAAPML